MEEEEKKAFFEGLYALDDSTDEVEDSSGIDEILRQSKPSTSTRQHNVSKRVRREVPCPQDFKHSLARTASAPLQPSTSFPRSTSSGKRRPTSLLHGPAKAINIEQIVANTDRKELASNTMHKTSRPSSKRKRGQSFQLLPESQQIFKGLSFYFFPNNDVARPRSLRIRKAMEYGALWIKEWKDIITHVIVDDALSYKDLLSWLKIDSLPPEIVVVNESYPSSCISFRFLLNPNQPNYRVKGYPTALSAQPSSSTAASSNNSLQVKPERNVKGLQQTPSRTDSSGQKLAHLPNDGSAVSSGSSRGVEPPSAPLGYARDALTEAVDEARNIKDLPLESEDDENASKSMRSGSGEDEDSEEEQRPKVRPKSYSKESWQENFSCMSKNEGRSQAENPNARTIEILQQMEDYYDRTKDHWRTTAYRKVISQLKKLDHKITTAAQASQLPCVGERLAAKIEEIVWTDKLRRLDNTKLEPNDEVLQTFLKIYGVGFAQASKWVDQGHRTIFDLVKKVPLTKNQKIGIECFEDFQARIPRQEMRQHDKYVCDAVRKIDGSLQFTIGGSYRRGAAESGDIDFIVTRLDSPLETIRALMLDQIIPMLFTSGYLKVGLATTDKGGGSKWHGAAMLPGHHVWRRIDFLFVPWDELGAALIYFTGNDIFNRSIRLLARKKGMRLNQRGLWKDVVRSKSRARITQGTLVEGKDEKNIFELLGVPWRPPEHRIC